MSTKLNPELYQRYSVLWNKIHYMRGEPNMRDALHAKLRAIYPRMQVADYSINSIAPGESIEWYVTIFEDAIGILLRDLESEVAIEEQLREKITATKSAC